MINNVPADHLGRGSRVVVNADEMPYLVDSVEDLPDGRIRVTYSSGDRIEYGADDKVALVAD